MKCAREVMEKWELVTNVRYTKELAELVETITEQLYAQASAGQNSLPMVSLEAYPVKCGRFGAIEFIVGTSKETKTCLVFQEDFLTAMEALCYRVERTSCCRIFGSGETYYKFDISPNPSC